MSESPAIGEITITVPAERGTIDVIAAGSQVTIDGNVSGHVSAVIVREHDVAYECIWWRDGNRNCAVLEAWEVQPEGKIERLRINAIL